MTVYYYNPNITEAAEFEKRAEELRRLVREMPVKYPVNVVVPEYRPEEFYEIAKGLEQEPETEEAKAVYDALKKSYTYSLDGDCSVNGTEATQKVRLRALNIRRTEAAISSRVDSVLQEMLSQMTNAEIYDETGAYRSSLTDAVYTEALNQALADADSLCETVNLEIRLQYIDGAWKMTTDRALMNALVGGQS